MEIREITTNKKQYMDLLLLGDEQENAIDKYLDRGRMYALFDDCLKAICVVTNEGDGILEIKNIATKPHSQRMGYGRYMIEYIENNYKNKFHTLQVGTGDSPLTIPFYEKCGFKVSHKIEDFFINNYDHPIYENGIQLKDMIYLKKKI